MFIFLAEQRTTQQGQVYYLHTQTGVSTWHDPRVPRYVCQYSATSTDYTRTNVPEYVRFGSIKIVFNNIIVHILDIEYSINL